MPWEQLESMLNENRALAVAEAAAPPVACPICGELLDVRPKDNLRNCPLGHYTWRG